MTPQEVLTGFPDGAPADGADTPAWLARVLEVGTSWRRSAHARLAPCPRCTALVLHAADMGLDLLTESTVDPALLTAEAELGCLLAGRYTAELEVSRYGSGVLVFRRDRWLVARPAAARRRLCVPEHRCNDPVGVPFPLEMLYPLESKINERGTNEPPPF